MDPTPAETGADLRQAKASAAFRPVPRTRIYPAAGAGRPFVSSGTVPGETMPEAGFRFLPPGDQATRKQPAASARRAPALRAGANVHEILTHVLTKF